MESVLLSLWNYVRNQYQKIFDNNPHIFGRWILNHCTTREAPQRFLICLCVLWLPKRMMEHTFQISFFFLICILYWNIVDSQCFKCTASGFSYTQTHISFLKLFSIVGYYILQAIDYSSLCYIVNLWCLLHIFLLES